MRVIVISVEPYLSGFLKVANKNLDIAAIVVPNEQLIKSAQIKFNENKKTMFYSYAYLEECLTELYYDYIIVAAPPWSEIETITLEDLENLQVDKNKIFRIGAIYDGSINRTKQMFNYVQKDIAKYKILITGVSHAWRGTDISCYELPAVSCAMSSQDLYYDYQFAKKIFNMKGSAFKYAVVGLAPFSFQSDESIGGGWNRQRKIYAPIVLFSF